MQTCAGRQGALTDTNSARLALTVAYNGMYSDCSYVNQYCDDPTVDAYAAVVAEVCPGCTTTDVANDECKLTIRMAKALQSTPTDDNACYNAFYDLYYCSFPLGSEADYYSFLTDAYDTYYNSACPAGSIMDVTTYECSLCPENTYNSYSGSTYCSDCVDGSGAAGTSPAGSDSSSDCMYDPCAADLVDSYTIALKDVSDAELCAAYNMHATDADVQAAFTQLWWCAIQSDASADLMDWAMMFNETTCPYCGSIEWAITAAEEACNCEVSTATECSDTVCDTFFDWDNSVAGPSGHTSYSSSCWVAAQPMIWCDGDKGTSAADQATIDALMAIGTAEACGWEADCSTEKQGDLLTAFYDTCSCENFMAMDGSFDIYDCFNNVCTDSACQATFYSLYYCSGLSTSTADLEMIVAKVGEATLSCPTGISCSKADVDDAIATFSDSEGGCMCGDLNDIYHMDDVNFMASTDGGAASAYAVAYGTCITTLCDQTKTACWGALMTIAGCMLPIGIEDSHLATAAFAAGSSCDLPNPHPECEHDMIGSLFMEVGTDCECAMPVTDTCLNNLCTSTKCQRAAGKVVACMGYTTDFQDEMMVQTIGSNMKDMNCADIDARLAACDADSKTGLAATIGAFPVACNKCDMMAKDFDPKACGEQICGDMQAMGACAMAYGKVASCFGVVDPTVGPLFNVMLSVIPMGAYCGPQDCSASTVQLKLGHLQDICDCDGPTDCLAKATACEFQDACIAAATDLIAECGANAPAAYVDVFTGASDALMACNAPKCDAVKCVLTGPYQVDPTVKCETTSGPCAPKALDSGASTVAVSVLAVVVALLL
jgi:hypothetical protein